MAHVISDECVSCGACEAECPVGAISQGADHYEIDADACVDCGACAAPVSYTHLDVYKRQLIFCMKARVLFLCFQFA